MSGPPIPRPPVTDPVDPVDPVDPADPADAAETPDHQLPPTTGMRAVDQAIAGLADLDDRPVSEHHEALATVHETLHRELESSTGSTAD